MAETPRADAVLRITHDIAIPEAEIELAAVRAQGAGGQNVNKVSSAIHLRFDIARSSLPDAVKARLAALADHRITKEGIVIVKAQRHRSQELNRQEALERLRDVVRRAAFVPKKRRPTKPTSASRKRRLEDKSRRGEIKALRGKIRD